MHFYPLFLLAGAIVYDHGSRDGIIEASLTFLYVHVSPWTWIVGVGHVLADVLLRERDTWRLACKKGGGGGGGGASGGGRECSVSLGSSQRLAVAET